MDSLAVAGRASRHSAVKMKLTAAMPAIPTGAPNMESTSVKSNVAAVRKLRVRAHRSMGRARHR